MLWVDGRIHVYIVSSHGCVCPPPSLPHISAHSYFVISWRLIRNFVKVAINRIVIMIT